MKPKLVLLAIVTLSGCSVAYAATYIARALYGLRIVGRASRPDNCTATQKGCAWADTATAPNPRWWDGTTDNKIANCDATTKGDICAFNGTNFSKLAAGTNGYVLTTDSAQTAGIKWAAGGGGSTGDYTFSSATMDLSSGSTMTFNKNVALADTKSLTISNGQWTTSEDYGIGTAMDVSIDLTNITAATGGTPIQYTPGMRMIGRGLDGGSVSRAAEFVWQGEPGSATTPITGDLCLKTRFTGSGAYTTQWCAGTGALRSGLTGNVSAGAGKFATDVTSRHFLSSATPTCAVGAGAGSGASCSIIGGKDNGVSVRYTTGSTINTGVQFTVTYGSAYTTGSVVVCGPADDDAATFFDRFTNSYKLKIATTASTFDFNLTAYTGGLTTGVAYDFHCSISGY